jgi:membrane protease YdiL (CAAX protease family)
LQNYAEQNRIQYFADILVLSGLVILCALVFGLVGVAIASIFLNTDYGETLSMITRVSENSNFGFLKFYNVLSSFGAWVVSGFIFSKIRTFNIKLLWQFKMPTVRFTWFLLPIIFISASYIASYLLNINQRFPIPEWLTQQFDSFGTKNILEKMLTMNSSTDYFLNIVVIALIPALFEEIFFRGTLQPLLIGFFKNHHLGIWFGAFIFALIHLNIHQVLPMMFLALVLGYLFYYTKSIYPSIVIHFLNNSLAVTAYYFKDKSEFAQKIVDDTYTPEIWLFIVFMLVLVTIFVFIIQQYKAQNENQ